MVAGFSPIRGSLHSIVLAMNNYRAVRRGTQPDSIFFQSEIRSLLNCDRQWLFETAAEYRKCSAAWRRLCGYHSHSRRTDGLAKTLDVAEGFAAWAVVKHLRTKVVVELGTRYGASARLWKEALKRYVPDHELILCDLKDERRFIDDSECTFLEGDARQTLAEVYATRPVDLLFNDAHPYDLIRCSVEEGLLHGIAAFAFHDVGCGHPRGPFKAESASVSVDDKQIHAEDWATYGHWERHVMADVFHPGILHVEAAVIPSARIQVFDSLFGFGVVIPGVS